MITFRSTWTFPFVLSGIVIAIQLSCSALLAFNAPPGTRWLGDTIENPGDAAVYISYLTQGVDGHFLLKNLYAVEPQMTRFDLIWSVLGLVARSGIPLLVIQEVARAAATVLLVFTIHHIARSMTRSESDARLATLLAFLGIGTGWMNWLGHGTTDLVPDLTTEFALAPSLIAGVRAILSTALLLSGLRTFWMACERREIRLSILALGALGILFLFHPYFLFLVFPFVCLTVLWTQAMTHNAFFLKLISIGILSGIPTLLAYLPLISDRTFVAHHTQANDLPLSAPWTWLLTLIPFLLAILWRIIKRIRLRSDEYWICAWLLSVIVACFLPLPFQRKFTEGLEAGLVLLTLPAWMAIRDWISRIELRPLRLLQSGILLCAAGLSVLQLTFTQLEWASDPSKQPLFYRSESLFDAWDWLHTHANDQSVVLADDRWTAIWTPSYSGRTVWIGHAQETPDLPTKLARWNTLLVTEDANEARTLLADTNATHLLLTTQESLERFRTLLGPDWTLAFSEADVSILVR